MIHICQNCAHIGVPQRHRRGSGRTELRLWLCLLLPGLLYSLWRLSTLRRACPRCHSTLLIRLDTPAGRHLATTPTPAPPPAPAPTPQPVPQPRQEQEQHAPTQP